MDEFDHRCSDKDCPYLGQSTRFASCKCKISREAMMLAAIERLTRENEALRKALEELLQSAGWHNYTNEELRHEEELGNGKAPILLRARAALALKEPGQ